MLEMRSVETRSQLIRGLAAFAEASASQHGKASAKPLDPPKYAFGRRLLA
jgi:hypothetical protein